jgi:hypothetical protein
MMGHAERGGRTRKQTPVDDIWDCFCQKGCHRRTTATEHANVSQNPPIHSRWGDALEMVMVMKSIQKATAFPKATAIMCYWTLWAISAPSISNVVLDKSLLGLSVAG